MISKRRTTGVNWRATQISKVLTTRLHLVLVETVYVTLADGQGITAEESYYPIWVQGSLTTEGMATDIGNAGYRVLDAVIEPYAYLTGE